MDLPPCYFQMLSLSANVTELILDRNTKRLTEEQFSRPPSTLASPRTPLSSAFAASFFVMFFSTFFRVILLLDNET